MSAWKRWQDYATMLFGVLVLISPLVFGETSHHTATLGAYVLGALLVLGGIAAALNREPRRSLFVNALGIALTAGLMAILTVAAGATLRMGGRTESKTV